MPTNAQRNLKTRKILFGSLLALICIVIAYAAFQKDRPWVVPEEAKKLKNPLSSSDSILRGAKAIYMDECAQCHAERGKGDGPESMMHSLPPADLTDPGHMTCLTYGQICYQLSPAPTPTPSS